MSRLEKAGWDRPSFFVACHGVAGQSRPRQATKNDGLSHVVSRALVAILVPAALLAAEPAVNRSSLLPVEQQFDERLKRFNPEDPFFLIGESRAFYVEGVGVVISAEVNLAPGLGISPFRPAIKKEDIVRVHELKLERLPRLRQLMQEMLLNSALWLSTLRPEDRVVLAVRLLNQSWEDTSGLPAQIVMQGPRKPLADARGNAGAASAVVQVKEY